jgi:two-component system, NtrC family, sensor histidine kinase HydH
MRRWSWIGLLAGFALGVADLLVATALGLRVALPRGSDWTVPTFLLFASTFAALGWVAGRLAEALADLRASQRRAVEYEKLASLGRAAACVAHEVRNPLAVIRSAAALLVERAPATDDEQAKAARFIVEEVDRLDGFVRRLLDFSRRITPARRATDIGELLDRVRILAGGGLEIDADKSVGSREIDPDLLSQALLSLALNAREAAGDSGRVRIAAASHGGTLRLEVVDDGPGIEAADAERIFEPFVTTRPKGIGLGLPLAQRVAEAHGGSLRLEGRGLAPDGRGARFVMEVPA